MNNSKWSIPFEKPEVSSELLKNDFNPLLTRVLCWKNIRTVKDSDRFIHSTSSELHDPFLLKDMEIAVSRLRLAIKKQEKIVVYGDYDVDGITASCLLTDYLCSKGIACKYHIPHREEEGYGLNKKAIEELSLSGVSLIVTVDCGITAVEETEYAKSLGIDVIITDHHECPYGDLPDAVAVIDYKRPDDTYPGKNLAGVGVAFKLVCAVEGDFLPVLRKYSDLVAIGTVADVMPLIDENRFLVSEGLNKINNTPRPGISAMMSESLSGRRILNASGISFTIAPRLNAAGRLNCADTAAQLLLTDDEAEALKLARELNDLNKQRQLIENEIWNDATSMIQDKPVGPIVLAKEGWNQGVIGIAASRLSERYCVPAIMICINDESGSGKGSCRSFGDFNLHEALKACSVHLESFGGHALAAGLNIRKDKIEDFRQALHKYYSNNIAEDDAPEIKCDLLIEDPSILSVENVRSLDDLEPYGTGNPKPVMCMYGIMVDSISSVGTEKKHTKMKVSHRGHTFDCIFFSHTPESLNITANSLIDIAFSPQINEFHGRVSVQLSLSSARPHSSEELCQRILRGDDSVYWFLSQCSLFPEKADRKSSWAAVKNTAVGKNYRDIFAQKPPYLAMETFCISLLAFQQGGWISPGSDGYVFGGRKSIPFLPQELEGTEIISSIRKYFNE